MDLALNNLQSWYDIKLNQIYFLLQMVFIQENKNQII